MKLLLVERMILESIAKGHRSLAALKADTDLDEFLLRRVVKELGNRSFITSQKNNFLINERALRAYRDSQRQEVTHEIKDLFSQILEVVIQEKNKDSSLKIKKVYLNGDDLAYLNKQQQDFEKWIEQKMKSGREAKTKLETVILWGQCSYQKIVQKQLGE